MNAVPETDESEEQVLVNFAAQPKLFGSHLKLNSRDRISAIILVDDETIAHTSRILKIDLAVAYNTGHMSLVLLHYN